VSRILPYPILAISLVVLWLLLNQSLSAGHLLLGTLIGIGATWAFAALQPEKPRVRSPGSILRLAGYVLVDIVRSNIDVARIILSRRDPGRNAGFMSIPLTLRDRHGLAVLACIITSTPGTMWVNYDTVRGVLLIHVLDLVDEQAWVETIKNRYERQLLEIFE
jgi:multicomponent K+:H+ antiporter subunit E